jgi:hypothetical protein
MSVFNRSRLLAGRAQLQLVVDEIVECNNSTDQRTQIDGHELIVCLQIVSIHKLRLCNIGQQVEHLLNVVDNGMIDWQFSACNLPQITFNIGQLTTKSAQAQNLIRNAL